MKSIELDLAYDEQAQKPVVPPQPIAEVAEVEDYYGNSFSYDASYIEGENEITGLFYCLTI